jgi:hypothetical protein
MHAVDGNKSRRGRSVPKIRNSTHTLTNRSAIHHSLHTGVFFILTRRAAPFIGLRSEAPC